MSRASAIARGRTAAELGMVDACDIERPAGESTSGGVVTATTADVYSGMCRLQVRQESGAGEKVGEAYVVVQRIELQLPMSAPALLEGDRVTMTASVSDPQLAGRKYRVRDVVRKTDLTARRVTLLEVTS